MSKAGGTSSQDKLGQGAEPAYSREDWSSPLTRLHFLVYGKFTTGLADLKGEWAHCWITRDDVADSSVVELEELEMAHDVYRAECEDLWDQ